MAKHPLIIAISFGLGVLATRYLFPLGEEKTITAAPTISIPSVTPPSGETDTTNQLTAARAQIAQLQAQIQELQKLKDAQHPLTAAAPTGDTANEVTQASEPSSPSTPPNRTAWRISAIEKFVPLSEEQRNRLTVKFEREATGQEPAESLEEILGAESATFYREQVKAAFDRARNEEVDREIVWLGRQLALTPAQERDIKSAFDAVETELDTVEFPESVGAKTPEERVKAMIAENKRREELRQERLKTILTTDQFTAYSRVQAESTKSDIEVFHGSN